MQHMHREPLDFSLSEAYFYFRVLEPFLTVSVNKIQTQSDLYFTSLVFCNGLVFKF